MRLGLLWFSCFGAYDLGHVMGVRVTRFLVAAVFLLFSSYFNVAHATPALITPADGSANVSKESVSFRWSSVADASSYRFVIVDNASFIGFNDTGDGDTSCTNSSQCSTTVVSSTGVTATNLRADQTFYWKVRANNTGWSRTFSFTTKADTPTPQITSFNPSTLTANCFEVGEWK